MGGMGSVRNSLPATASGGGPTIVVETDHPLEACIGAQYAGWPIKFDDYFAMGSGPMRLRRGREAILVEHELREQEDRAVGVLESRQLPPASVCLQIADECQVPPEHLCLLVAPVSSLAGTVQVVARSIETAIHKLHAIDFDIRQIRSAWGAAPLPPVAINDLQGIGRTNDAILYGAEVTLWVHADDDELRQLGPLAPSCSSRDYGRPFAEIFSAFDHDFYKIDPLLFSPAVMSFVNLRSGRCFRFGQARPDLLGKSFGCESAS